MWENRSRVSFVAILVENKVVRGGHPGIPCWIPRFASIKERKYWMIFGFYIRRNYCIPSIFCSFTWSHSPNIFCFASYCLMLPNSTSPERFSGYRIETQIPGMVISWGMWQLSIMPLFSAVLRCDSFLQSNVSKSVVVSAFHFTIGLAVPKKLFVLLANNVSS